MTIRPDQEQISYIEEVLDEDEFNSVERRDSMWEANQRDCNEIMLQFVSDFDSAYDFVDDEEEIAPNNDGIQ